MAGVIVTVFLSLFCRSSASDLLFPLAYTPLYLPKIYELQTVLTLLNWIKKNLMSEAILMKFAHCVDDWIVVQDCLGGSGGDWSGQSEP